MQRGGAAAAVGTFLAGLAAALTPATGARAAADGPRFVGGDAAALTCRVVKAEPVSKDLAACLLTVEVRNSGRTSAEPVRFELRAKGRAPGDPARTVRRAPDPVEGRAGRAVAPGGSQTYVLAVAAAARGLAGASVRVSSASYFEGTGTSEPPIVVEDVTANRVPDEAGVPVWETSVRLRNELECAVDAVFVAVCREPADARLLVTRRLAAREATTWTLREAPLAFGDPSAPRVIGVAAKKVQLVDWSVVADDGRAAGAALLADAWTRWVRWEEPFPAVRGTFTLRVARGGRPAGAADSIDGRFALGADGVVTAVPSRVGVPELATAARDAITEAFADLRRPSAAKAVEFGLPALVERGPPARVVCAAPPNGRRGPSEVYLVEGGVLRGREDPETPDAIRETWTTAPLGDGYLVTACDLVQSAIGGGRRPCDARRWTYAVVSGRAAPVRYVRAVSWTGAEPDETTLALGDLTFDGGGAAPYVADAPEGLRAAWDAPYRYPRTPVDLTAKFRIDNAGTEALWRGARSVSGRLTLVAFTGMRPEASRWARAEVELDGKLPDDERRALAALVEDRLMIWAHRDFAARKPFDVVFRGARIAARAGETGVFDVANGPCTRIVVKDGRVVDWDAPELGGGAMAYERVGDVDVVASLRRGESLVEARFKDAGGGWLVPVEMRFERVFGADWGPETVRLSDLRLSPSP